MKKVIIAGSFDCLKLKHVHLIKEALKLSIGGELVVLLYDGFNHFKDFGYFPMQPYFYRENNLSHFVKPESISKGGMDLFKNIDSDHDILFVHYGDDKDFPGREILREKNIKIKFIKPYAEA